MRYSGVDASPKALNIKGFATSPPGGDGVHSLSSSILVCVRTLTTTLCSNNDRFQADIKNSLSLLSGEMLVKAGYEVNVT